MLLISRALSWLDLLVPGTSPNLEALTRAGGAPASGSSRILPLAFPSPEFIVMIVEGRQPKEMTLYKLKRLSKLPIEWNEQPGIPAISRATTDPPA